MQRRNLLIGMGSLAAGGAATIGTGAFTSVAAGRNVSVSVAGDADAYLGIEAGDSPHAQMDGGTLGLNFDGSEASGDGLNTDAFTKFNKLFSIQNNGPERIAVWLDDGDPDNPEVNNGASADLIEELGVNSYNILWSFSRDSQSEYYSYSNHGWRRYDPDEEWFSGRDTDYSGNDLEYGLNDNPVLAPTEVSADPGIFNHPALHPAVLTPGDEIEINLQFNTVDGFDSASLVQDISDVEGEVVLNGYSQDFAQQQQ